MAGVSGPVPLRYQNLERPMHYLAGRVPENALGSLIEEDDVLRFVDADNGVG